MKRIGLVFPGQGSQKVGMGQELFETRDEVRDMFGLAQNVLGRDMAQICFEGPEDVLTKTVNAQPGIFLVSAALLGVLREKGVSPVVVAGHSLGEITAYYAAGVLSLDAALGVIQARGDAMAASYPSDDSAMAAIMKIDLDVIQAVLSEVQEGTVVAANLNCPGQIVISGTKAGVAAACTALSAKGGRAIPLNVSGAFHSPLMQMGADVLADYVKEVSFVNAHVPIVLNRLADVETDAEKLRDNLSKQVVSSVRWIESIQRMSRDVDVIVECGPGKVLTGLCKKIVPDMPVYSVSDLESIAEVCSELV